MNKEFLLREELREIEELTRKNYIGVENKDKMILEKNIQYYKKAQFISKKLYKLTNNNMYISLYEQYYLYSEKQTLLYLNIIFNNFDKALNEINEMLRILENIKKNLDKENNFIGIDREKWKIIINSFYLNNQVALENIKGEKFAIEGDFESAKDCYQIAILNNEAYMKEVEKYVRDKVLEPIHLNTEKANLAGRKGQFHLFLAIQFYKDDVESCLSNLVKGQECFKEARCNMGNVIETKEKIQDFEKRIKKLLIENLDFKIWLKLYRKFKDKSLVINVMEEINQDLFKEIRDKEEGKFMIDNRGGNFNNNGNIGENNTIINTGTIGNTNIQDNSEIMKKLNEAIDIIKNSTELEQDEKACILEQIEAIKQEKDTGKIIKLLTSVKLMGGKLINFVNLISPVITLYKDLFVK